MLKVDVLKNFRYTPVLIQAGVLSLAILAFDYAIKPFILDEWAIEYTNFLAYSFYTITLLGIIEGYLRASALQVQIEFTSESVLIKKSSFIPLRWYNRTIKIPYTTLENIIISKEPVDLGHDIKFFSKFRRNFSAAFLKKRAKIRHEDRYYITLLQTPEFDEFNLGILNFRADISLYNNAVLPSDATKIISEIHQKVNLKFVFN